MKIKKIENKIRELKGKLPDFKDRQTRALLKYFAAMFVFFFIVLNWSEVSWAFNYQFLSSAFTGIASEQALETKEELRKKQDEFLEKIEKNASEAAPVEIPLAKAWKEPEIQDGDPGKEENSLKPQYTEKENSIYIAKIGIEAPVIVPRSQSQQDIDAALKKGVISYPGSMAPGSKGAAILLGHSAGPSWPKIYYDWVFSDLNKLENGDIITVYFNHQKFDYEVVDKTILKPGQEIPDASQQEEYVLFLVTCWPPGSTKGRIAVKTTLTNI